MLMVSRQPVVLAHFTLYKKIQPKVANVPDHKVNSVNLRGIC